MGVFLESMPIARGKSSPAATKEVQKGSGSSQESKAIRGDSPPPESKSRPTRFMTNDELCEYLAVSRSTLDRLVKAGGISGRVMIGRQARWDRATIEAWLRERMT